MLRRAYTRGAEDAFKKFGLAQPSLGSVGIQSPVKAPGLPSPTAAPTLAKPSLKLDMPTSGSAPGLGIGAAKAAADALETPGYDSGSGAVRGEPADQGRRQRSVIDRTFQANEDNFATSSMPAPGGNVSP